MVVGLVDMMAYLSGDSTAWLLVALMVLLMGACLVLKKADLKVDSMVVWSVIYSVELMAERKVSKKAGR